MSRLSLLSLFISVLINGALLYLLSIELKPPQLSEKPEAPIVLNFGYPSPKRENGPRPKAESKTVNKTPPSPPEKNVKQKRHYKKKRNHSLKTSPEKTVKPSTPKRKTQLLQKNLKITKNEMKHSHSGPTHSKRTSANSLTTPSTQNGTSPTASPLKTPSERNSTTSGLATSGACPGRKPLSSKTNTKKEPSLENYLKQVLKEVERHKFYPPVARRLGIEGRVKVEIVISPEGQLSSLRILSSPSRILTSAVVKILNNCSFPKPPTNKRVKLEFVINFKLEH